MNSIVVFGSGGHAKVVVDIVEKMNQYQIIGLIDNFKPIGTVVYGYEVLGDETFIKNNKNSIKGGIVAIGDNWTRSEVVNRVLALDPDFKFISAAHPTSSIAKGVQLGEGTVIMAGAIVNSDTIIGKHCILNSKSSIDHDSRLGDFVTIAPNATTGGNILIGEYSTLSLGANVIHSKKIGEHTVIGAGSTVLTDIESYVVAYGIPAKVIRRREKKESYL